MAKVTLQDVLTGKVSIQDVMKDQALFAEISAAIKTQATALKTAAKAAGIKLAPARVTKASRFDDPELSALNEAGKAFLTANLATLSKVAGQEGYGQYVAFTEATGRFQLLFKDLEKAAKAQADRKVAQADRKVAEKA